MGLRRQSRELALHFLYSCDMQDRLALSAEEAGEAFDAFCQHFGSPAPDADAEVDKDRMDAFCRALAGREAAHPYARTLVTGVCQHLVELDASISAHSHNWRVARMSGVYRNILRIAAYELRWAKDAPPQVVINEALEIAKCYSIDDSVSFINGILAGMPCAPAQPQHS